MVNISSNTRNKAEVSVIRVHENNDVNKTLLRLLCICDLSKRSSGKNIYDLIGKEIKGKYNVRNMSELTKPQNGKYKIDRARFFTCSKHSRHVHEKIATAIIMQTRLLDPKTIKFDF